MEYINVVILCGGLATRLGEITKNKPKILVEFEGKPFLDYLLYNLEWCKNKGIEEDIYNYHTITFASGTQDNSFYIAKRIYELRYNNMVGYQYITDTDMLAATDERVGTAGSLKRCEVVLDKYFDKTLVINGDSYISKEMLYEFIKFSIDSKLQTILLGKPMSYNQHKYPNIMYDYQGIINKYKTSDNWTDSINGSSAGYYMFDKTIFSMIEKDREVSLEDNIIPKLVDNLELQGFPGVYKECFFDIGTPSGMAIFNGYINYKDRIGESIL